MRHQVAFSLGCLPLNAGVVGFGGVLVWHLKPIFFRILATVPALLSSSGLRWICVQSCEGRLRLSLVVVPLAACGKC